MNVVDVFGPRGRRVGRRRRKLRLRVNIIMMGVSVVPVRPFGVMRGRSCLPLGLWMVSTCSGRVPTVAGVT